VRINTDYYVHHICFFMLYFDSAFYFATILSSIAMKEVHLQTGIQSQQVHLLTGIQSLQVHLLEFLKQNTPLN
jgi:hypothetical protein